MSEHKLDEETRRKMLTRLPFSRNSTITHTPKAYLTKDAAGEYDIPDDFRPVFSVRPFSSQDKDRIAKKDKSNEDKLYREVTASNITGMSQLYDAGSMEEIDFKSAPNGGMDMEQFMSLPVMVQIELYVFIAGISGLSVYEKSGL